MGTVKMGQLEMACQLFDWMGLVKKAVMAEYDYLRVIHQREFSTVALMFWVMQLEI